MRLKLHILQRFCKQTLTQQAKNCKQYFFRYSNYLCKVIQIITIVQDFFADANVKNMWKFYSILIKNSFKECFIVGLCKTLDVLQISTIDMRA